LRGEPTRLLHLQEDTHVAAIASPDRLWDVPKSHESLTGIVLVVLRWNGDITG